MFNLSMMKTIGILMVGLFAFQFSQAQENEKRQLPDITLKNMNGQEVSLSKYADNGKKTIISFWATWCKPCKKELTNLNELLPTWRERYNAELLAISIDDARNSSKVEPYVNGKGWDFNVLLDTNKDTKRKLNYSTIPYSLIVNEKGEITYQHSGYYEGDEYEMEDKLKALNNK